MQNLETLEQRERQQLKAFVINRMLRMERKQKKALNELKREAKNEHDLLSVDEVLKEFKISRSTFDRWRVKGLKVNQEKAGSAIKVYRKDILKFIKD